MIETWQIGPHRVEAWKVGDQWFARATVHTSTGPITLGAQASEATIKRGLARARVLKPLVETQIRRAVDRIESGGEMEVGDIWASIDREITNIARSKVYQDMANGLSTVTNSPYYDAAMVAVNVIPGYGQAISAGMMGLKATSVGAQMLADAKRGDPKARKQLATIQRDAKAGDPRAQRAMARLRTMNEAPGLGGKPSNPYAGMAQQATMAASRAGGADARNAQAWGSVAAAATDATYQGATGGAGKINYGQLGGATGNAIATSAGANQKTAKAVGDWASLGTDLAASYGTGRQVDWAQTFGNFAKAVGSTVDAASSGEPYPYAVGSDRYDRMVNRYRHRTNHYGLRLPAY